MRAPAATAANRAVSVLYQSLMTGVVLSLIFWSSWGGFGGREVAYEGGPRRRRVIEEDV